VTADHHPRYVVREQHGTTVGEHAMTWTFLILDSWYGYREVLWVNPSSGATMSATPLRRRVYAYAARLNGPPTICACGCGIEVPIQPFRSGGWQARCVDRVHARRARYQRDRGRL
jgi:hypothetical protein